MLLEDKNVVIYGAEHRRRGWTKPENRDKYERLLKPRSQDDRAHPRRECNEPRKERTEGDNRMRLKRARTPKLEREGRSQAGSERAPIIIEERIQRHVRKTRQHG
jgi:hypothetical protein